MNIAKSDFSADAILKKYSGNKIKILEKLTSNYKALNVEDVLNIDRTCRTRMGFYDSHLVLKSNFCCNQCHEMNLLVDLSGDVVIGAPFSIGFGSHQNKLFVIEMEKDVIPKIKYYPNIKPNLEYLFNYFTSFKACDSTLSYETEWLSLDQFTNQVLISIILEKIVPLHMPIIHNAFICGNDGYMLLSEPKIAFFEGLFEYPELFNDKFLKPEIVKKILKQICDILSSLKPYNFCHNNATINALRFDYQNEVIVQINNFEHAAINLDNVRLYNENTVSKLYVKNEPFIPDIKISNEDTKEHCVEGSTYKFNTESGKQILNLRRLGIPIYNTSFDLYCFLISLVAQPEFYQTLISDPSLSKVWKSIWSSSDIEIVNYRIGKIHEDNLFDLSIEKIVEILSTLTLKCDFLDFLKCAL